MFTSTVPPKFDVILTALPSRRGGEHYLVFKFFFLKSSIFIYFPLYCHSVCLTAYPKLLDDFFPKKNIIYYNRKSYFVLCSTYNNDDSGEMRMPKTSMTKIKTNVLAWMYIKYSYNFVYFSFFPFYLFIYLFHLKTN